MYYPHNNSIIFKNYKGGVDIDKLLELNNKNYQCDPSGGYNYKIVDKKIIELFDLKQDLSKNTPKCYLKSIVKISENNAYDRYCLMMTKIYKTKINILHNQYHLFLNQNLIPKTIQNNLKFSIKHIKDIGLEPAKWFDVGDFKQSFVETVLRTIHSNITPYLKKFKYKCNIITINNYKTIKHETNNHLKLMWKMSESIYQYIDKLNPKKWKQIELYFNNLQKQLQKFLKDEHNININNRYVTRAWVKMYEILNVTKYFKYMNNQDVIKALHICEAPGSFIASTIYYTKHNTNIKKYDYTAQSLKDSHIFDEFGFIRSNPKKWDFGSDGSGDIMTYKNLKYYYEKYKGVDSLVGDCGTAWNPNKSSIKDLSTYQLLYGLLIPREGGNFILKSFATNFNLQYLSLLNVASCKFKKLYFFRSSRNIWSPEIYIIGINKKKLSDSEILNLFSIAKGLEENKVIYPIERISTNFLLEYEYNTQNIINMFTEIKTFWVYLLRNPKAFADVKEKLDKFINRKNIIWIRDNLLHIKKQNFIDKYRSNVKPLNINI
jgi:hypothetical protein